MTTDTALTTSNVDPDIAAAMTVFGRLQPLQDALGLGDLTEPEMQLFAMVAHHTGLDPFTRQLYAIKRRGKVVHQTGIDGYRSVAERTREYAGSDEPTFEDCGCGQDPKLHPSLARVVVHRILANGHVIDQAGVARWHELYPGAGEDGFMWRKMPFNQLAKCAEANALRKAFPRVLGGVYIEDEMQQANVVDGQARPVAPTAGERIAQRRRTLEAGDSAFPGSAVAAVPPSAAVAVEQPEDVGGWPIEPSAGAANPPDGATEGIGASHVVPSVAPPTSDAWTADRVRLAATAARITKGAVSDALMRVADGRPTKDFESADWAAVAADLGLEDR